MPQEKMKTQGAWEVYHLCIHNPQEDVHHNRCGDLSSLSIIIKKRCTATNVDKRGSSNSKGRGTVIFTPFHCKSKF